MTKLKKILKEALNKIKPHEDEIKQINEKTNVFVKKLSSILKNKKILAEVFLGGSFAKNTFIKKRKYDIDLFVRFEKKYKDKEISRLLGRVVPKGFRIIHGSRDYFSLRSGNIEYEIVPVLKILHPGDAVNITDLSYFHVNYIKKKINASKNLADEIRLAKAFAYSLGCYGAESYINGFSGYALELLVAHYKSFISFIRVFSKIKPGEVIDSAKHYKNKEQARKKLNASKLYGPLVLIDPTFKERNALAALSLDTFGKFQEACKIFLKNPSISFFEFKDKKIDFEKKYSSKIERIEFTTKKQSGDIAGTKLKKFYKYFLRELDKFFYIKDGLFDYNEDKNSAAFLIVCEPKKERVINGPPMNMPEALKHFAKHHKKIIDKYGRAYAIEKNKLNFKQFVRDFLRERKKTIREMGIEAI